MPIRLAIPRVALALLCGLAGCGSSPCKDLNAREVAVYDACGVTIPTDLEDGGSGNCAVDDTEAECVAACYEAAECNALDGSDDAANQALYDCSATCAGTL